jgi:hypothetical protein
MKTESCGCASDGGGTTSASSGSGFDPGGRRGPPFNNLIARIFRAIFGLFVFVSALSTPSPAAELKAEGIAIPFFDAAGKPTHRLAARRGTLVGTAQKLQEVELVYFSLTDPKVIVQKLVAAEATWDSTREILTGTGAIEVTTEENKLTGEGFDFALATSLLHIHRKFTMNNREAVLTSDRAVVELIVEQKGDERKVRDVKTCEAIGNLHVFVQPAARAKYKIDEAWSTLARYDSATRNITFPEPTRYVAKGARGEAQVMVIELGEK